MSVLVVHDTPIKTGYHRQILEAVFQSFDTEFELTNVVPFMHDKELKKIKAPQWLEETERLQEEASGHEKVLTCGGLAASAFFGHSVTYPVTRIRGRGFIAPSGQYTVPTYSPSTIIKDTDFFRDLCFDIEKLLTHDAPMEQPDIEIQMCETRADLSLLEELHGASFVACDIETTSFNPYEAGILGIGFGVLNPDNSGYVVVVPQDLIGVQVRKFLRTYKGTLVFHNIKFDIQHIWRKWGRFPLQNYADTMLMAYALDERPFNRYRNHGLDLLSRLHLDAPPKRLHMGQWLEEYFRKDVGDDVRWAWMEDFCTDHAETARTCWRKWYEERYGEEPDWRGRKVGRDIEIEEVYDAVLEQRMPLDMQPPPTQERKQQMWDEMLTYMGEDCYATARLYPLFKQKIMDESPRLMNLCENTLFPASMALANMELGGARVDIPYLSLMKKTLEAELEQDVQDIRAIVCEFTNHPKGPDFNPNSSLQVAQVLYNAGDEGGLGLKQPRDAGRYAYKRAEGTVTTNSDTLKVLARQVAPNRPAVAKLINQILQFRVKSKILSTYVDGILERVDGDERVRGDFLLHGTATGRLSCSNPNLQNIPDASHVGFDIRKAYIPTSGWTILEADYSQLELRVAALFSQDPVLIQAYRDGADIHQEVAYMLWEKPKDEITKYERYLAKCMNFGVIYGRGAKSIATGPEMDNLVEMSGRSWGNKEIEAYFAKFKKGYKNLFDWMDLMRQDSLEKQFVEDPLGHRRRFDLILNSERAGIGRQAVNTPIQGFAAYLTVRALIELDKRFDPEIQRILFTVHDSIMCECVSKRSIIKETAKLIKETMENILPEDVVVTFPQLDSSPYRLGDQLGYNLPLVADVVAGPSWGDCHDEAEMYVDTGALVA
jgi:DNA polymerase I-like protein with 3'-5' exonuclease and polymerase domains